MFLLRYAAAILTVLAGWLTDAKNCGMLLALFIVGIVHRKERLYLRRTDHEKTHILLLPSINIIISLLLSMLRAINLSFSSGIG